MSYETIRHQFNEGVAEITLAQPDTLNALSQSMMRELREVLEEVSSDKSVRAVLITGEGRGFSSGANLVEAGKSQDLRDLDLGELLEAHYHPVINAINQMPKPVIAAVNGIAAGAGMSLAIACDIVLAARSAQFIQVFIRIGAIPDAGSTWSLPRRIGDPRARALAMTGEPVGGEQAAEWGLAWKCVEDESLRDEAWTLARKLAAMPTRALGTIKQAYAASLNNTLDEQLALEARLQSEIGRSCDFVEGVTAFLEKRPAQFTGE